MTRIVLHEMIETEDRFETGPAVAQIIVGEHGPRVEASTAALREKVEAVLATPLMLRGAVPGTMATVARPVSWQDGDAFIAALTERLRKPDLRLECRAAD